MMTCSALPGFFTLTTRWLDKCKPMFCHRLIYWVLYGTVHRPWPVETIRLWIDQIKFDKVRAIKQINFAMSTCSKCFFLFSCRHQSRQLLQNQPFSRRQWLRHRQLWIPAPWVLTFIFLFIYFAGMTRSVKTHGATKELLFRSFIEHTQTMF